MTRRGAPALYELMRRPSGAAAPARSTPAPPAPRAGRGPSIPDSFTITLGRAVLLGVGFVLAISIAYGIGVQRGRSRGEPAAGGADAGAETSATRSAGSPAVAAPRSGGAPADVSPASASNNNADPRVKGMWYYVIAHPSPKRAPELVEFCRKNGLDAHRVPDDNALSRKIIVLPGYRDPTEKSSPEIKSLHERILAVGQKWKGEAKGNQDFAGTYAEKFR